MGAANNFLDDEKLSVILIGVGSAAFVITIYHCVAVGWCNRHQTGPAHRQSGPGLTEIAVTPSSIENSTAQLIPAQQIPAHKYQKSMGLLGGDGDVTCAVCLSEFEEGEELRTLPECLHSYHAPCIDMWLYSHSSCPMCRTDATPLRIFRSPDSPDSEGPEAGMLRHVDVQ